MIGFEIGCSRPFRVRTETVGSAVARRRPWRLLLATDLHLTRRRRHLAERLASTAAELAPDVVVFGGDLVDRRGGLAVLARLVESLTAVTRVIAIPGNHDRWCGVDAVRDAVVTNGGDWLPAAPVELADATRSPVRFDAVVTARADSGVTRVLVAHHPVAVQAAAQAGYTAVLAGHLHGGQCVLWRRGERMYPGAWLSRWNGERFRVAGTTMLVSNGLADTLPIRFRCPREVVLCHLHAGA